jgi:protein phosphatase
MLFGSGVVSSGSWNGTKRGEEEGMRPQPEWQMADTADYVAFDELVAQFYEVEPRTPVRVEFGAMSHPGLVHENNEDHYAVVRRRRQRDVLLSNLPEELFDQTGQVAYAMAIADGMGGRSFGELASLLALRTAWDLGSDAVKWPVKMNQREAQELRQKAYVFFRLLDRALHDAAVEQPRLAGMGTTLTICYTTGPELFILHAGDSRAYLHRTGALQRLTRDHTLSQALIDAGLAEPGSREARAQRHVLTNCLGGPSLDVEVDVTQHRLHDGDRLLLCTDGLTDLVEDAEIARLLNAHPGPDDACHALIDLALQRGGKDNITVIIAHYAIPAPDTGGPHTASDPSPAT